MSHDPGCFQDFLLLPGDGLLLVRASGEVCFLDSTARERMGEGTPDFTGSPLEAAWPELAGCIERSTTALQGKGQQDLSVTRRGREVPVRLFHTDDGVGVGLLAIRTLPDGGDPRLLLMAGMLREVRDGVVLTTAEPHDPPGPLIVYANPALLAQTGYSRGEVLGRSPRLFQGVGTSPAARAVFRQAMKHWQPARQMILNYNRRGAPFWVEIDIAPIADADGWYTHWVSVQRELDARRPAPPRPGKDP